MSFEVGQGLLVRISSRLGTIAGALALTAACADDTVDMGTGYRERGPGYD